MALSTFTLLCNHRHHPSPELFYLSKLNFCTQKKITSLSLCPPPAPENHHSTFCLSMSKEEALQVPHINESYSICPLVTRLFHLMSTLLSKMSEHVSEFPSFLTLYPISLYIIFCLSTQPSTDTWLPT